MEIHTVIKDGPSTLTKPKATPGAAPFAKLPTITLRDRIAEILRNAILNGTLAEGSRIVERKLATQFDTSLTVVREALIELEVEGFVIKKPNSSTYVTKLSMEITEKIFSVRRILETYAVEQAAEKSTPEAVQALEAAYRTMLDAARNGDLENYVLRDYALHEVIWSTTQNEYLTAALKRVLPPVFAFAAMRMSQGHAFDLVRDAESHWPLVRAICDRAPATAHKVFLEALDKWLASTRSYVFETEGR